MLIGVQGDQGQRGSFSWEQEQPGTLKSNSALCGDRFLHMVRQLFR